MDIKILEERRAFRTEPLRVTEIPCSECGRPLIKNELPLGFRLMCDNHECHLFREGQGIDLKSRSRTMGHFNNMEGYLRFIKKRSENYYQLRDMGFGPQFATRFKSTKQTKRIGKLIKRGLAPDFIVASLQ